jgi:hypothetical protein
VRQPPTSLLGFAWRFAVALVLSGFAFWCLTSPEAMALLGQSLVSPLAWTLDAPVSALNLLLPPTFRSGFARQFLRGSYDFPGSPLYEGVRYLAVGIPAYLVLLYLPSLGARLGRRGPREVPHGA